MKWMIASDLHGSEFYCKKMIEAFEAERADKLLLLGDLLYHGPRNDLPKDYNPKAVIVLLNSIKEKILCVRGNCEAEVDQMVLEFPVLAEYAVISAGDITIFATHGHKYNEQNVPPFVMGGDGKINILMNGHTHVPACREYEDYIYMNPGSMSMPKENSHHGYMTLSDNSVFEWKDFEGNIISTFIG
jgi:hypothetical protein